MKRVKPTPAPTDPCMKDRIAFGQAIRAARTGAGMTLVEAAATMGVSKQTLSDLEKATGSVGLATALRIGRELGVGIFAVQPAYRTTATESLMDSVLPREMKRDDGHSLVRPANRRTYVSRSSNQQIYVQLCGCPGTRSQRLCPVSPVAIASGRKPESRSAQCARVPIFREPFARR